MKMSLTHSILALAIAILAFANAVHAQPAPRAGATELEIAQLPPYCHGQMRRDQEQMRVWSQRMGREQSKHLGHFCMGLLEFQRASTSLDNQERRHHLARAIKQMDYVLSRWPKELPLYQDAETYRMQAESLLNLF